MRAFSQAAKLSIICSLFVCAGEGRAKKIVSCVYKEKLERERETTTRIKWRWWRSCLQTKQRIDKKERVLIYISSGLKDVSWYLRLFGRKEFWALFFVFSFLGDFLLFLKCILERELFSRKRWSRLWQSVESMYVCTGRLCPFSDCVRVRVCAFDREWVGGGCCLAGRSKEIGKN